MTVSSIDLTFEETDILSRGSGVVSVLEVMHIHPGW